MGHDPLARLAVQLYPHRRTFTRVGLAALGVYVLLVALSFTAIPGAWTVSFRLGSLIALPWLPWMWIFWFHPARGSMRPESRSARFLPGPLVWLFRWYGAFVIAFAAVVLLAAPFLLEPGTVDSRSRHAIGVSVIMGRG